MKLKSALLRQDKPPLPGLPYRYKLLLGEGQETSTIQKAVLI